MTKCVFEGCTNTVAKTSSRRSMKFCTAHAHISRLSPSVVNALRVLVDALASGYPFVAITLSPQMRRVLIKQNDWVFESPGLDGVKYKITSRGEKALRAYDMRRTFRVDGRCPNCNGARPRHVTESGRVMGYCIECLREFDNDRSYEHEHREPRQCATCGDPAQQFSSGLYGVYCASCQSMHAKENELARVERIRRGEESIPLCKCGKPRVLREKSISRQCPECHRKQCKKSRTRAAHQRLKLDK